MEKDHKRIWKCPECRNKLPKSDNTNTPVRSVVRDGIPGMEPAETGLSPTHSSTVLQSENINQTLQTPVLP
ncbi:unnamed protein product [Leptidea sinapis]|uniref:Uncharacterized protein n=1 Tax=Leptidea sinapis TaxID=189913 RepID=A0A5E4R614_9NEOP|nr:unnamed protein product [Leptidea sinapis]